MCREILEIIITHAPCTHVIQQYSFTVSDSVSLVENWCTLHNCLVSFYFPFKGLSVAIVLVIAFTIGLFVLFAGLIFLKRYRNLTSSASKLIEIIY